MTQAGAARSIRAGGALPAIGLAAAMAFVAGCSGGTRQAVPPPTFTPAPTQAGAAPVRAADPVVSQNCLRGLTSYRFNGSFSLQPANSRSAPGGSGAPDIAGSIANLLRNVSFQGSAHAPDRYAATVSFGGNGVQSLQIVRIGPETYSRFGDGAWQAGDRLRDLGSIAQFDPQTLCQSTLESLDAGNQVPAHETVSGVPALRYELSGAQLLAALAGDEAVSTPRAGATAASGHATVWTAEEGGYPLRFQIDGASDAGEISLLMNVTDVNGKDIQISAPLAATPRAGR